MLLSFAVTEITGN